MKLSNAPTNFADEVRPAAARAMELVDIGLIQNGHRIRTLKISHVEALKKSIAVVGLVNPLSVYRCSTPVDGEAVDGFGLIAGAHRLAACRDLGHAQVPVVILDINEPQRIIAECDENLHGTRLSPTERALFTRRRKEAYEQLHPETKHGGDRRSDQVAKSATRSFADETAAATGKSARTVRLDAERGTNIPDSVLAKVQNTKLDHGVFLDKLKGLPVDEQEQRVQAELQDLANEQREVLGAPKHGTRASPGTSARSTNSRLRPSLSADRPGRFASLLQQVVDFTRAEFNEWLSTESGCKEAIRKANNYADSATAMIRHFQAIHPKVNT